MRSRPSAHWIATGVREINIGSSLACGCPFAQRSEQPLELVVDAAASCVCREFVRNGSLKVVGGIAGRRAFAIARASWSNREGLTDFLPVRVPADELQREPAESGFLNAIAKGRGSP